MCESSTQHTRPQTVFYDFAFNVKDSIVEFGFEANLLSLIFNFFLSFNQIAIHYQKL